MLYEKGMDFQVIDVDLYNKPEDIAVMNPYNRLPVLVERDLILYESNIINEYIDERFPHPQLMPADPACARAALCSSTWRSSCSRRSSRSSREGKAGRARAPARRSPDRACARVHENEAHARRRLHHARRGDRAAPWRLDHYGIKLGKTAAPLMKYAERIFSRPAFIEALTPSEKVMRK